MRATSLKELCDYALSLYGIPYQWGGEGPQNGERYGYDCSGLVQAILRRAGLDPTGDQSAHDLYLHFKKNGYPGQHVGSLAFFGSDTRVSHVGFMLTDKIMISAAGGGANVKSMKQALFQRAFVKLQPISWYKIPPFLACYSPMYQFGVTR